MTDSKIKGYGFIKRCVMRSKDLTIQAKALYALLASYAGNKDECHPSVNQLVEDLCLSKPMVVKYLGELESKNYIIKSKLSTDPLNHSNKYTLLTGEIAGEVLEDVATSLEKQESPQITESVEGKVYLTIEGKELNELNHRELNTLNLAESTELNLEGKADLTFFNKELIVTIENKQTEEEAHIVEDVCLYFGIKEGPNFQSFLSINHFSKTIHSRGLSSEFVEQFEAYKVFKTMSGQNIHSLASFLGNGENNYENGAWCSQSWIKALENYKPKDSTFVKPGIPTAIVHKAQKRFNFDTLR